MHSGRIRSGADAVGPGAGEVPISQGVPALLRKGRQPLVGALGAKSGRPRMPILSPAARKAIRQRMLLLRSAALERIRGLTGASAESLKTYRRELSESPLPDLLLARGAGGAFVQEFPQGGLLYLLVRAQRPRRVVETGVRPGYSTAWILSALEANGEGRLTSLGPGSASGRAPGVHDVSVGQFVAPALRGRWTLALGNSEERLGSILADGDGAVDLFFYDNGPDADRARFELRSAWGSLGTNGILLAHHVEASPVWSEFCRAQGMPAQILDPGPPPLGALGMRRAGAA
ncbi:MAG TPA: class I SAM-dependent methyltransferase [Thermoplasmata archaeon]|nr:class I SAM-dependent methyltransferase [Thermoplasmata archaeon]